MLGSHLKSLLKKNLLIAKSTFILSTIDLLAPIIIMLGLWLLKSAFVKEDLPIQNDVDYVVNNSSLLDTDLHQIIDGEVAYRGSIFMCDMRNVVAFVGKDFPRNLANKFIKQSWETINIKFKYYDDFETLSVYVKSKEYGVNEGEICFAVSFKKEENKYLL